MNRGHLPFHAENAAGLAIVVALHGAALWGLWQHRLIPSPQEAFTLFVDFIAAAAPETPPQPPHKPRIEKPQPSRIVATAPVVAPTDYVAPPPPPEPVPVVASPPAPPAQPKVVGPIRLDGDLAPACSVRTAPVYPPTSRRLGEEGKVVLRVDLDEYGHVSAARISVSSGFARLDAAALDAVRSWRCTPARRDGQPVAAVALQPFNFVLQES